ncbi:hypothetical protein M407DRAFT_32325 [Tulasnella calospora MUT 4182]|uniref:Uncharacterized protein n=1 Tax=Tulasnella calospora MUT 4182 TaxID=1051891 RepID=A0A0C3Q460_9AGAM|nr:hypothetical protein M407DRAFT_32325 [Tulasnella calospora MUT 4182]
MARGGSNKKRDITQVDEAEEIGSLIAEVPSKPPNKKINDSPQEPTMPALPSAKSDDAKPSMSDDNIVSGNVTATIKPAPATPVKACESSQPTTPAHLIAGSSAAQTPASVLSLGKVVGSDDGDDAGGFSGDEAQRTTPKTPRTPGTKTSIALLDPAVASVWDMSERKKALILKLLDVHSGTTFAIRRMPTTFRYGSGEHRDRLVSGGCPVTIILVGRVSRLYFETTSLAATINVVPLLSEDLKTASMLIARYSQPVEQPKDYPSIRASANQVKEPGTGTYKLFSEIYDATCGLKRKQDEGAELEEGLNIGDLVALELHIKKYTRQNEKARHASLELVAVQLLRRGNADDVDEVQTSVTPAKRDAFDEDFFSEI